MRASWRPKVIILMMSVALLVTGGNYLHDYSVTTRVFVAQRSNSTLVMHPTSTSETTFSRTNTSSQYRFSLDVNATLYFGVFELESSSGVRSVGFCNISGDPIFETESAEFNKTLSIGPGYYAYMICNRGTETAFGEFQYSVLTTFVTHPRYSLGSFLQIASLLVVIWGVFLLPEALSPRSRGVRYSRFLRWTLLAPALLLVASVCFGGAISAEITGRNADALSLAGASLMLMMMKPELLSATLKAPLLLVCFSTLLVTVNASLLAHMLRVRWRRKAPRAWHPHRLYNLVTSFFDPLSKRFAPLVLPDGPHVGVFVRLGTVSLFTAQVLTMSPWEFLRALHPYLNLPSWILPEETSMGGLGPEGIVLPIAMSVFGLFAYSLKWKPSASSAFRMVRTAYTGLFFVSLFVVLWHLLSADYLIELAARFITILPLTLVSAYLAWMSEILLRRTVISWKRPAELQSDSSPRTRSASDDCRSLNETLQRDSLVQ